MSGRNWLALLGWGLTFVVAGFLAADTIATMRQFGLTGVRPPLPVTQTAIRIAIVWAAFGLLPLFRDSLERFTAVMGAAAAGSSALHGFGLRADALSAFRLLSHLALYVLAMLVAGRRIRMAATVTNRVLLALALCLIGVRSGRAQAPREPSDRLDRSRPHIQLFLEGTVPAIKWFASAALTGAPVAELNADGLFLRGRLACSWPGGRYDVKRWNEMVLGYEDAAATIYRGCPSLTPVRSFWYEEYGRHAQVLLEVVSHSGSLAKARCGNADCYFDLNDLPGDPRTPDSAFQVRLKGSTGWDWELSRNEQDRLAKQEADALRRDRTLAAFIKDARTCLKSSRAPTCFAAFVKDQIYYPEARIGIGYVTPEEFATAVWRVQDPWGDRAWTHLVECFDAARGDSTRVEAEKWYCEFVKTPAGWRLEVFFQGD